MDSIELTQLVVLEKRERGRKERERREGTRKRKEIEHYNEEDQDKTQQIASYSKAN